LWRIPSAQLSIGTESSIVLNELINDYEVWKNPENNQLIEENIFLKKQTDSLVGPNDQVKELQSTLILCMLKRFHCFVFCHFISQFSDEGLTPKRILINLHYS
jgi:hypothetical protein